MNNKKKITEKILLLIWVLLLFLIPSLIIKIEELNNKNNKSYISSDLKIDKYDVTLDVDKDNKIDVTEVIKVNIPDQTYNGIYREIPLWQQYYDKNIHSSKKKIIITNLRVIGEKFELNKSINNIGIKIGSKKINANPGIHTYTIKYRYNMGMDFNNYYDDFVFNVFDGYNNTKIDNMTININMPKKFDKDKIKILKGKEDVSKKINYVTNNNSLFLNLTDYTLDDRLTINVELPNNYFVSSSNNYGIKCLLICLSVIVLSIISVVSWLKYGKNLNKKIKTVEFYPPDNLDVAQIGYLYGEKSIKKLTTALIIQLASKKYILINETKSKKYEIIKIKNDLTSSNNMSITEQIVYLELFKNGDTIILSEDSSFSKVFKKIEISLNNTIDKKINDKNSKIVMNRIFRLLIVSIICLIVSYLYIKDLNPKYEILYVVSFIAIFITGFFSMFMNRRTAYGEILYAKVQGFRDFLITTEKQNMENQILKNPNYFYDILPYTYVLNISDKWIKKFDKSNLSNIDINLINTYDDNLFMFISE